MVWRWYRVSTLTLSTWKHANPRLLLVMDYWGVVFLLEWSTDYYRPEKDVRNTTTRLNNNWAAKWMNRLLSKINNPAGLMVGKRLVSTSCFVVLSRRTNTDRHEVSLWCWRQHLCVVLHFFCEWWALEHLTTCNHIPAMVWDDHQCPFRGFRNDDSEGQGVMNHDHPQPVLQPLENNGGSLLAFGIYTVTGLWQSWCVWSAYGLQWLKADRLGAYYHCIVCLKVLFWMKLVRGKMLTTYQVFDTIPFEAHAITASFTALFKLSTAS